MSNINERAVDKVVKEMRSFRPGLTRERIVAIVEQYIESHFEPMAETSQDVWWAYQRALEEMT